MNRTFIYFFVAMLINMNLLAGSSVNLLKNPGFEDGLKNWSQHEWSGVKSKINFSADKKEARSGESCAKIEWISGGDNILLSQRVSINGEKNLLLNFWSKSIIQTSTNDQVQVTAEFFNKKGKRITNARHKIFTTSDIYEEFSWSFKTPPDTVAISILLRCRRTITCFDDVKLIESSGIFLKESIVWLPNEELILDIFNDLEGNATANIIMEVYDKSGKLFVSGKRLIKAGSSDIVGFPVKGITPGTYKVKVYPADNPEVAVVDAFVWPPKSSKWPAPFDKLKVKNNFVTELFNDRNIEISSNSPLGFMNPRLGWVFFSVKTDKAGILELPGVAGVQLHLEPNKRIESMQYLPCGENIIFAKNDTKISEIIISTMPEVIASEFESDEIRYKFVNGLMESLGMTEFLRNSNIVMERFANSNKLEQDEIPSEHRNRIATWRSTGRKTITTVSRTGFGPRWGVKPIDTENFWMSRVGLTKLDGLAIDEFARESEEEVPFYDKAVKKITAKYPGKTLYAYTCPSWYSHTRTIEFRKTLAEGNHAYTPELYMREQRNEGTAKIYINNFFDYLRHWERAYPGAMHNTVWTYGSSDGYYASYVIDTFPNANHKYFLDLQFSVMANDPLFFGMRGVCPWIIRYAKPDTLAWQAKLIRHYCIEGNKTMLSDKYDYKYDAEYLKNPDFENGLDGWQVKPAAPGSIVAKKINNYGFNRGTRNTSPDGDNVILMTRVPGKINRVSQTISNLKPGADYEISLRSADYEDVITTDINTLKVMPVRITIEGAEVNSKASIIHVYPVAQKMKPRKKGICGNHYEVIFRASSPSAKVIISDEVPDIAARQFHSRPFAPADSNQKSIIFNFVQVQELLPSQTTESE
ncbi:MAG: hypothetical protein PHE87_04955 [Victivallaceae bacterium]|nr:hypothetical protein [Victivallaceae bacterium]